MGIISKQNQFLLIHIPKTGGTSLKNILKSSGKHFNDVEGLGKYLVSNFPDFYFDKGGFGHAPASHLREFLGDSAWNRLFKFAIIRNPWDRMVSAYSYMQQTPSNKRYMVMKEMNFTDFIRLFCEKLPNGISHLFTDEAGKIILDKIYRLEDLDNQSSSIQQRCGVSKIITLPHENKSDRQNYRSYYSDLDAERVLKACQLEISIGNYRF